MNFKQLWVPVLGLLILFGAYRAYGWPGVALAAGGLVMFLLLNFNRAVAVLRRAADRPIGTVASAVMLNVKVRKGHTLMHVIALTRALGELRSPKGEQPEHYRWTDNSGSYVDAQFMNGKLQEWSLTRPQADAPEDTAAATAADETTPRA
ncbi:glycerate kinase [Variovorax sp.]|uniref:glycerate kinase n=1 Tax=Variovorax sp. TaxID=1871043 RepID=UPI002D347AEA|nr:glycerate kinase [Variovorax sp.]HYP85199.1 glycerate kinase [Variovorax sp.]